LAPVARAAPRLVPRIIHALDAYYANAASLEEEMARNRAERKTGEQRIAALEATLPLITERAASLRRLERRSLAPRVAWLELEEDRIRQQQDLEVGRAQLAVNTIGGVVTPAQRLMLIVPDADALRVEAWIANKDIGFVRTGQTAKIKVETFPFTKYGVIDGAITTISNDAVAHDKLGLVYLAQVRMAKTTMRVRNRLVRLAPGMAVTVEVDMGRRRVIEFVLTPLLRLRDEGLRER